MDMEECREGVDYHRDGADVGWKLAFALGCLVAAPVTLLLYLLIARPA